VGRGDGDTIIRDLLQTPRDGATSVAMSTTRNLPGERLRAGKIDPRRVPWLYGFIGRNYRFADVKINRAQKIAAVGGGGGLGYGSQSSLPFFITQERVGGPHRTP